ncbi:MAG: hypothetical protein WB626_06230 [Bacteroidota bacterium]
MKTFTLAFLCVLACDFSGAQPPGPPQGRGGGTERVERLRKIRMAEMLELEEERSVRFFARLAEHERAQRSLRGERMQALDRLELFVRTRAAEASYEEVFARIAALDRRLGEGEEAFVGSLAGILTPVQRARFLLFERQFERELRQAMREARGRRPRAFDEE